MKTLTTILIFQTLSIANAAELRGKLTGIRGASVNVTCPNINRSSKIAASGDYRVAKLAANQACSFIVKIGKNAVSTRIPFSTRNSVTIYNGNLRQLGNRILVIRQ